MRYFSDLFSLIYKVYFILSKKQRWQALVVLANILVSAGLETLSISVIIPFVTAILTPEKLWGNKYIANICNAMHIESDMQLLVLIGIFVVAAFILKDGYLVFSSYLQIHFRFQTQKELTMRMLNSYLKRPYSFFVEEHSSKIIRSLGNDAAWVRDAIENFFNLVTQTITMIAISVYLVITDYILAMGVVFVSCICIFAIVYVFKNQVKKLGELQREANALVIKNEYETINGVKEIMVMKRQEKFVDNCEKAYERTRKYSTAYNWLAACPAKLVEVVFLIGLMIFIFLRLAMGIDAASFVPQFAAFAVGGLRLMPAISGISGQAAALLYCKAGIDASYQNLKAVEKYEREQVSMHKTKNQNEVIPQINHFSALNINHVSWNYDNSDQKVLEDLSLSIQEGESIALIGESGAGKTTLVDIILGLFEPRKGSVEIDGINISSIPDLWGRIVAYVPQSIFLIDDTIKSNIAFGLIDENIDEELVWDVLERAQLKEFVMKQPNGLNTIVGERGIKFSGGQRQRVAIARALYNNPQILVLDEATAALDNDTEEAVLESIESLQGEITLIIVAHRLTTVRNCDKIYEVKDGKAILRSKEEVFKVQEEK